MGDSGDELSMTITVDQASADLTTFATLEAEDFDDDTHLESISQVLHKQGFLLKANRRIGWKPKFFLLHGPVLAYFASEKVLSE
jgi:hypothetical protein